MKLERIVTAVCCLAVATAFLAPVNQAMAETTEAKRYALCAAQDESGVQTYKYDSEGNMTDYEFKGTTGTVHLQYSDFDAGVFGSTETVDGVTVRQRVVETNEAGAPTVVRRTFSNTNDMWTYFIKYHENGAIKQIDVEKNEKPVSTIVYSDDGTINNIGPMRFAKSYDGNGRLSELAFDNGTEGTSTFVTYEYDDEGRITKIDAPNLQYAYECTYEDGSEYPSTTCMVSQWGRDGTELSYKEVPGTPWTAALDKTPQANDILNDANEFMFDQYASNYTGVPHTSISS